MINLPKSTPSAGYGFQKTAGVPKTNDPYKTYQQSVVDHDEIWNSLRVICCERKKSN